MTYVLVLLLCVAADQAVKYYTVTHLALYGTAPLIPGFIELLYIQNTGGGFSILEGHTWALTVITAALMAAIAVLLVKRTFSHPLGMWTLTVILGGGLGNLIDRIRLGYVVDMFNFQFMNYPVFNVADICIVGGCVLGLVYYQWFEKYDRKENANGNADAPSHGS